MRKISLTVGAIILGATALILLLEIDFSRNNGCTCSTQNDENNGSWFNSNPTDTTPTKIEPSSSPAVIVITSSLQDSTCVTQDRSIIEQVCFDPNTQKGSTTVSKPQLSMPDVKIPQRTESERKAYIEDENRYIAHREVIWIEGKPFPVPPEVIRIDTYNLGPGRRSSIRVAHWNHPCNLWYNSKIDLSAAFLNHEELEKWAAMIKPGSVAIDVGAHVGDTTVPIAVAADMTIAFEPMVSAYPVTWTQSIVNPQFNIHTHRMAVGNRNANLTWAYDCNGGVDSPASVEPYPVQMVVLPDFLKETYSLDVIKKISFIKTDTEGHDMDIVETLQPLIDMIGSKPILFVEWYIDHQYSSEARARYYDVATKMGYVLFSPGGERIADIQGFPYCRDLVLIPTEMEEYWKTGKRANAPAK